MNVGIWGWDGSNYEWVKALIDDAGHFQIDVVSSVLPTGAPNYGQANIRNQLLSLMHTQLAGGLPSALDSGALKIKEQSPVTGFSTYGQQNIANQLLSLSYTVLNTRLPSALDTDSLKIREQGTPSVHLYGVSNSTWYNLLVQTSTDPNLRVALYAYGNVVYVQTGATAIGYGRYALVTDACLFAYDGSDFSVPYQSATLGDGTTNSARALHVKSYLAGFNGNTWDRLRSYGTGILAVAKGAIAPTITRMTGTGQVGTTGAKKLFWIACSPDDPNGEWELSDATEALQTVVYDHFDSDKHSEHIDFNPPIEFTNGIWVEKFDHQHSLVFCYQ